MVCKIIRDAKKLRSFKEVFDDLRTIRDQYYQSGDNEPDTFLPVIYRPEHDDRGNYWYGPCFCMPVSCKGAQYANGIVATMCQRYVSVSDWNTCKTDNTIQMEYQELFHNVWIQIPKADRLEVLKYIHGNRLSEIVGDNQQPRYKNVYPIVTLCGSTRFKDDFIRMQRELTLKGHIVLSVGLFGHSEGWYENGTITEEIKQMLDEMHKEKIAMSDEIMVINKDGYIGESTKEEIKFAESLGLRVLYMEDPV